MLVGILSDTHGLLREEVVEALSGCDLLLHGGDVGEGQVLEKLEAIAPVIAVSGNADKNSPLPIIQRLTLEQVPLLMVHQKKDLSRLVPPQELSLLKVIITGHTHRYLEKREGGLLYLNPGSCGPRRLHQDITLMKAIFSKGEVSVQRIDLPHQGQKEEISLQENNLPEPGQLRGEITKISRLLKRNKSVAQISHALNLPEPLVEQVVRLYLTHPGVDEEGILRRMGL